MSVESMMSTSRNDERMPSSPVSAAMVAAIRSARTARIMRARAGVNLS
jgi:hypothetical protein